MYNIKIITYKDDYIILIEDGCGKVYQKTIHIPKADISDEKMRIVVALCNALEIDPEKLKEMV